MRTKDVPSPIDLRDPETARAWTEDTVRRRPWRPEFFQAFAGALNAHSTHSLRILELGSGPGHLAKAILEACDVARYVAFDFSAAMHALAREHLGPLAAQVDFQLGDFIMPDWTKGLGMFDAVVTLQAAHETRHKAHLTPLLEAARGVIVRDGILLYCDHYYEAGTGKHPDLMTAHDEQPRALREAGFSDVECLLDKGGMALYRAIA